MNPSRNSPSPLSSLRPQSAATQRPPSSISHYANQYGSSASVVSLARPTSSASIRPTSRASYRPKSRQQKLTVAKLLPFCQDLVRKVLIEPEEGNEEYETKYHEMVDWSIKQLGMEGSTKAALVLDTESINKMVRGHVEKARVKSQDTLANALERCYGQLNEQAEGEHDLDDEIKATFFLLAMSSPPQPSTSTHAALYLDVLDNPPPPAESEQLTWKKILEEDPYEGDHWVGVPDDGDESPNDLDISPSLSPLNSDDLSLDDTNSEHETFPLPDKSPNTVGLGLITPIVNTTYKPLYATHAYRQELEGLKLRQYWQPDWRMDSEADLQRRGTFDIGDASTLGPTLQRVLPQNASSEQLPLELILSVQRHILEEDAVREVLIALQGRQNIIYDQQFRVTKSTPKLLHFSLASQQSLLNNIGASCRTLHRLRQFTSSVMRHSSDARSNGKHTLSALDRIRATRVGKITRTLEAFADAIDTEIRMLEVWCSDKEEAWLRALGGLTPLPEFGTPNKGLVVSLLGTEKAFRDQFEDSFNVMLDVVIQIVGEPESEGWTLPTRSPSLTTTLLLDTLFSTVQQRLERGDKITADTLMRVCVRSAEPVWNMIGKWIGTGFDMNRGHDQGQYQVGGELEEEFFIESNGLGIELGVLGLLDPDFWQEGYSLRDGAFLGSTSTSQENEESTSSQTQRCIPSFLQHVAVPVLESGKAIGLLKALGTDVQDLIDKEAQFLRGWQWTSFQHVVAGDPTSSSQNDTDGRALFSVSVDQLSRLIYDKLTPYAQAAGSLLAKVIFEKCDFWSHLRSIESIYLMRRGDIISDFTDILFAKIDSKQDWTDFHFLNTAFSEVVTAGNSVSNFGEFIETSLIRLSYRGGNMKEKLTSRTVKIMDGLSLEYAVPFPLTYIFTPVNLQIYNEIFVLLLRIRRAKSLLEKILVRGASGSNPGLKAFYAMRSRLSWFVNTFLNFLTTYVIQTQALSFHNALIEAQSQSFDQVIKAHEDHVRKMENRCLLQAKTNALYQAVLSILDMTLNFNELFGTFAGDVTMHDISSHSVVLKHHRSRKQRRRRKNVIGFSYAMNPSPQTSDSEMEGDEEGVDYSYSVSINASTFAESDDLFTKINKMSADLDGLVRFIRRGIDTLAGGTGDASTTFGILAFSLEDWDL
ncbi:Spc98 family-domain-containing protein [Lentinula aff. lateritia]|uniref:Spc98 family-domain-containing protein n=1 Tax=Lentinula aff. lateritia TaxID=2804960 RepID=A0ACC1TU71_9AGAR|nr:Spc98 family-domain-containing protein [Lentinula aff. lateritia]